jgi:hypothetical protein
MTVTAQGLFPQGVTPQGIGSQPGSFGFAFPAPIGAEQFFGIPQALGWQQPTWQQPAYAGPSPYAMPVPYGQPSWVQPQQAQQVIGQLVWQILPVAQQMILPQILAMGVQVVQQLIAQMVVPQLLGQPFWTQPAAPFASGLRPYAGLS